MEWWSAKCSMLSVWRGMVLIDFFFCGVLSVQRMVVVGRLVPARRR